MRMSVFIAVSLDGMIARTNGDIDWLTATSHLIPGEDFGYGSFISTVDALLMGRRSFEKVLTFGEWPYGDLPVYVLSNTLTEIPNHLPEHVQRISGSMEQTIQTLKSSGYQHVYVDGGKTVQSALRAGAIDHMIITRIPILIGEGISLFGSLDSDIHLKHVKTVTFKNGLIQSLYDCNY